MTIYIVNDNHILEIKQMQQMKHEESNAFIYMYNRENPL
jgi:hypothetical protein